MGRRNELKQIYIPYWDWECYRAGMWSKVDKVTEIEMIDIATKFTGDHIQYGKAMSDVVFSWKTQ